MRSNVGPPDEKLTPADPDELAAALAFALKFEGRKRQHDADAFMADIVARRLVRYLERARYVLMKRPPLGGHSAPGRGLVVVQFDEGARGLGSSALKPHRGRVR